MEISRRPQGGWVLSSIAIACIAFAWVFGGALLGLSFRNILPEDHLSADTKDIVKV